MVFNNNASLTPVKLAKLRKLLFPLLFTLALFSGACAITAPYDQYVYAQTTGLKVDALKLMEKAERPFDAQKEFIDKFTDQWDKLYEYELHRKNNGIRITMWNLLRNPERNLMGGFLKRWKTDSVLSPAFISEAQTQVGKAIDQLSELESGKLTPKELK